MAQPLARRAREKRTVLIVDADSAFRRRCIATLQTAADTRYEILEADTALLALDLITSRDIDSVLIDEDLPDSSGMQLLREIQLVQPDWPGSVVLIAESATEECAMRAFQAGATDHIQKRLSPERFRDALLCALEMSRPCHVMRKRNADLLCANRDLRRRTGEIARSYHRISHEVKAPLTAARMYMSMLHAGLAGALTGEQQDVVAKAIESCDQLSERFNELGECARLETGKAPLRRSVQSLKAIIRRSIVALKPIIDAKSIRLVQHIASDIPAFAMDGSKIVQVVANILDNAGKFTSPEGRIELTARLDPTRRDHVEISICDSGCGIPTEHVTRIFEPLYQVASGRGSAEPGLGLGLAIAKEIVELHKGTIEVSSKLGKGTTFTIRLPMAERRREVLMQ